MRLAFLLLFSSFLVASELEQADAVPNYVYWIVIGLLVIVFFIRQYELKKINNQLIGSIHDIETIMNSTVEGIVISQGTKCLDLNESALELLQIEDKSEVVGLNILDFIDKDSKPKVIESLKKERAELIEIYIKKKDGTSFPALVRGKNIDFLHQQVRVSLIVDMSDIKQKELKFLQQSKLAALGEMIANIAHQWRQPLSVISTSATGMKLQKEHNVLSDEKFFDYCDLINENAQYLSQTIEDFRNFIRGDMKAVRFNLKNDTDSFIKLVDGTIKRHNIQVILKLQENINIQGYPNELIQCFINIFNNAKDALVENVPEDERYMFISEINSDEQVLITFKDNAGGIPEDILPKIFEPYFTTKEKTQGTGLGLHMSYNLIVNGMKGELVATNETYTFNEKKYTGAQFKITIPVNQE